MKLRNTDSGFVELDSYSHSSRSQERELNVTTKFPTSDVDNGQWCVNGKYNRPPCRTPQHGHRRRSSSLQTKIPSPQHLVPKRARGNGAFVVNQRQDIYHIKTQNNAYSNIKAHLAATGEDWIRSHTTISRNFISEMLTIGRGVLIKWHKMLFFDLVTDMRWQDSARMTSGMN